VGGYLSFTPTALYVETECLPPPSKGEANKVKLFRTSSSPVDSINLNHLSSPLEGEEDRWGHVFLIAISDVLHSEFLCFGHSAHQLALRAIRCSINSPPPFILPPCGGGNRWGGLIRSSHQL